MTTNRNLKARIVRIKLEEGHTGLFYATSPDLKGLLVAEPTLDALHGAIPRAISDLYAACGEQVVVTTVELENESQKSFIALPAEVARRALDEQAAGD